MDGDSGKTRILLVEDTLPDVDRLRTVLEGQGYEVMVATSGEQAIERAGQIGPDLILLDVLMPGMDGFETCRRLRAEKSTRDIPVIFMTAPGATESKAEELEAGAVDYVIKPVEVAEVLARVRTHLSLRNMRIELETQNRRLQQQIAERKAAQEALKASEERYRTLVESSSDAILVLDPGRRVLSCNQAFLDLFGYARSDVEGQSIRIIHPSDESYRAFGERIYPVIKAMNTCRTEWDFVHKDGTPFPVETVTSAMRSSDGSVQGYVAIIRDITQRRLMEVALRESEANYRLVIENANESIIVAQDGVIKFANPKALEWTGYTADELISRPFTDFLHPDDREMVYQRRMERLRGEGTSGPYPIRIFNREGDCLWVEVNAVLTTWHDRPATLNFLTDTTEHRRAEAALRESEQRLRMIIDAMPVLIHAHDTAGEYVFWNKECERVTGYTSEEIVGNPRARDLLYPDPEERKVVEKYHKGIMDFREWECVTTAKDSSRKIIAWTSRSTHSPIPGWLSWETGLDITDRKRMEDSLRESEERFRILSEKSRVGVYLIQDNLFRYVNPAFAAVFGYGCEEIIDRLGPVDFLAPQERELVMESIRRRTSGDMAADHLEFRVGRKDGTVRDVEVFGSRFVHKGRPAILGTLIDITERRRAEAALLESEAQKRAILDASIDRIRYVDKDMRILWANKTTTSSLNRPLEELVGKTCHKALRGRDTPCVGCPTLRSMQTGRIERAVLVQPVPGGLEGGTYWDNYCVPLKNEDGDITGLVQVARNITAQRRMEEALRESEARYRSLVEQIPAITYTAELDEASTTLYVSPQIERIIGFTQSEYGRDPDIWRKQIHPDDRNRVLAEVTRSHQTGESLRTEYRMLHRRGDVVWLRDEAVIVKDSSGRPLHLQGVMFDISGAKQAEERIHVLSQELMKAHEKERRMLSLELHDRVAQDLSTAKIGLDTLLYSHPEAPPEAKNVVSQISGIIQGSITAVRDLAYDLRPPSLDQLGLVQSINQYCEDFSEKTGLVVDFTSAGIEDLKLDSETEINLYRLVQEGLINVWKHAEAAHVVLRLVASFPDIILRIADDGRGFDVEERRQSLTHEKRMGLRSMEERVRWLGGSVDIKSSPGKGTKIVIHIPHKEKKGGPEEDAADRG